jgi:hypothetical protein
MASELLDQPIDALDGRLGTLEDLYFDDRDWSVRCVLVKSGLPMRREHLLVETAALQRSEWPDTHLGLCVTRREARSHLAADALEPTIERAGSPAFTHLRSMRAVSTYRLSARDGYAGRVKDLVIDDRTWSVAHVEADVLLFIGSKPVLIPPHIVEGIDTRGRGVAARLNRHALGGAPRFQRLALHSRLYQMCLFDYYATAEGAPLMRPSRTPRPNSVDARMLLSTMVD